MENNKLLLTFAIGTIIFASCLPYLQFYVAPIWILLGIITLAISLFEKKSINFPWLDIHVKRIIYLWSFTVAVTFSLDILAGPTRNIMSGPILNLFCLLIFIGIIKSSKYFTNKSALLIITTISVIQGTFGLLQFLDIDWAWRLPQNLSVNLPFQPQDRSISYEDIDFIESGRVKGTHIFIHVFNAVMSAIASIIIFAAFNAHRRQELSKGFIRFLRFGAVVGAVAVLLSFSRSGMVAIIAAIWLSMLANPSKRKMIALSVWTAILFIFLILLQYDDASQYSRLWSFYGDDANSQARIELIRYALDNFYENPFIGTSGARYSTELDLPIHSVPFRFLSDYGSIGLLCYASVFIALVIAFAAAIRERDEVVRYWGGAGMCLLLAIASDSWTHSSGLLRKDVVGSILSALILGQIARARARSKLEEPSTSHYPGVYRSQTS